MFIIVSPDNEAIFKEKPSDGNTLRVTRLIKYTFPNTPGVQASDYTLVGTPVTTTNVTTNISLNAYSDVEKWIEWSVDVDATENALQGFIQYMVYYLGSPTGISTLINVIIRWLILDPESLTISLASYDPETRFYLCDIKNGYESISYDGPIRCEVINKKLYISAGQDLSVGGYEITVKSTDI